MVSDDLIPQSIRAQLLALGIPGERHTQEALAELFPKEFNIRAAGLDGENLGRVLVHLAAQGLVSVPGVGSGAHLKKVAPGWHFCQFYRDDAQYLELLTPYIAEGLRDNQGCLWVMPNSIPFESALEGLSLFVGDVERRVREGQLELLHHEQWYLDHFGNLKSFEQIATALLGRQEQMLARGYKFMRAAGDGGWVSGTEQSKGFIDYEMKVSAVIGQTQTAAICTFRADTTADELIAIITAHQHALEHPV